MTTTAAKEGGTSSGGGVMAAKKKRETKGPKRKRAACTERDIRLKVPFGVTTSIQFKANNKKQKRDAIHDILDKLKLQGATRGARCFDRGCNVPKKCSASGLEHYLGNDSEFAVGTVKIPHQQTIYYVSCTVAGEKFVLKCACI
jgi:hypothetical protein